MADPLPAERPVERWLRQLEDDYNVPGSDFQKRIASWKSSADVCTLLYILVSEVRQLRVELAAQRAPRSLGAANDQAPDEAA